MKTFGAASLAATAAITLTAAHEIENVVVIMLENRAFDHMLGYMSRGGEFGDVRVNGLRNGTDYCNLKNLSDPSQGKICVSDVGKDHVDYDPNHSFGSTTERIFGNCVHSLASAIPPALTHAALQDASTE
jgi:phospholipase C